MELLDAFPMDYFIKILLLLLRLLIATQTRQHRCCRGNHFNMARHHPCTDTIDSLRVPINPFENMKAFQLDDISSASFELSLKMAFSVGTDHLPKSFELYFPYFIYIYIYISIDIRCTYWERQLWDMVEAATSRSESVTYKIMRISLPSICWRGREKREEETRNGYI